MQSSRQGQTGGLWEHLPCLESPLLKGPLVIQFLEWEWFMCSYWDLVLKALGFWICFSSKWFQGWKTMSLIWTFCTEASLKKSPGLIAKMKHWWSAPGSCRCLICLWWFWKSWLVGKPGGRNKQTCRLLELNSIENEASFPKGPFVTQFLNKKLTSN